MHPRASRRSTVPLLLLPLALALAAPAAAQNPLARAKAKPDPFAREFGNDKVQLVLGKDGDGYRGTLTVESQAFPARAGKADGERLQGTFEAGGEEYAFACTLQGDTLVLESDGERYELQAKAAPAPANPLARGSRKDSGGKGAADDAGTTGLGGKAPSLPELQGVYQGPVAPLRHPDGLFTAEMPKGWSIAQTSDAAMMINCGFTANDTLDCLLLVTWGELDEEDRNLDVVALFEKGEQELLDGMQQQGIEVGKAKGKPRKVAVGERAGAEQTWAGRAQNGPVTMWCGGLVEGEYYLAVVAIVMQGKDEQYLPGARRLFRSLQPKAPERNAAAERSIAGASFASQNMAGTGGAFHTIYTFRADGTVTKQMLASGPIGGGEVGGDSEESGRWRAAGDVVYLQFRDGQQIARIESANGNVTALRFGNARYARR